MKVIILAGGFATKLYPITENEPKALLEVGNKSVLGHLIANFESTRKVSEYIIVSNHKFYAKLCQWANTRNENITVIDDGAASKETIYGAVKDIQLALDKFGVDEDCVIAASDLLFDFSFVSFIDYSQRKAASCCLRFYEESDIKIHRLTVADMAFGDKVNSVECKPREPKSQWCIPNFIYLAKQDLGKVKEALDAGIDPDSFGQMIEYVANNTTIYSVEMPGAHARLTNEASLRNARKSFNPYS